MARLAVLLLPAALALRLAPRMGPAAPRPLGGMESLFAPRRSLASCALPPTAHVVAVRLERPLSDGELRAGLEHAVAKHALLSRRVAGSGAPAKRGPLGAPVGAFPVWRNVLAPFGDDNMRIGPSEFAFVPMDGATPASVVEEALEPRVADWQEAFTAALGGGCGEGAFRAGPGTFDFELGAGPLWRACLDEEGETLLLCFDHCVSDQPSAMGLVDDVLKSCGAAPPVVAAEDLAALETPPSLEDEILGRDGRSRGFVSDELGGKGLLGVDKGSLPYLVAKATEPACQDPLAASPHLPEDRWGDASLRAAERTPLVAFRTVSAETLAQLRATCRARGTTVGSALAACAARAFAALSEDDEVPVKVLQSLDMRRFGKDKATDRLACRAGSMDLFLKPADGLWDMSREAGAQLQTFEGRNFGEQSVRVFDWAVDAMEMTRLVELESDNPFTLGRAYCCGVSNAGLYRGSGAAEMYYATSTTSAGASFQASCVTVQGKLCVSVNAPAPLVTREQCEAFATLFVAEATNAAASVEDEANTLVLRAADDAPAAPVYENGLVAFGLGAALGLGAHAPAVLDFLQGVARSAANGGDLLAPYGFWLFFATMHPLIGGAGVGLGEVMWGFPGYSALSEAAQDAAGPPLGFLAVSVAASAALASNALLRSAAGFAASLAFFGTVSSGLAGTSGDNGSLNLSLDDAPVAGKVEEGAVRGCPSYAQVKQPSMNGFDVTKYKGRWYEHAYHDWTQFAEVYDTTLDIDLAADGRTWVDDFAVRGPSPRAAPRSWRGSPVANGAHYPLYGSLDPAKPGELLESGFGNVFPNFIVDVTKDAQGNYQDAIQFQCLESGGVRVFEGINFLSRDREISPARLQGFFDRAAKAGMAPYGARPDQMHVVEHAPADFRDVDNWWQKFWTTIGVDKLLALVAADI